MAIKVDKTLAIKDDKERAKAMILMFNRSTEYMDSLPIEKQEELSEGYQDVVNGLIYAFGECLESKVATMQKSFIS